MLRSLSVSDKLLDEPLIPYWPDSFHIPGLIRFLAGVEDFACRSAQLPGCTLNFQAASRNWYDNNGTCLHLELLMNKSEQSTKITAMKIQLEFTRA